MTLQSMTGFARQEGQDGSTSWVWEIRSVNGKGLDLRLRVPSGYEVLEAPAREILGKCFSRGNMQINLQVSENANDLLPKVNEQAVTSLIEAAKELQTVTTVC
ncbi:MAG: YicC/YloC family endoribonuclease, partial [Pseudomonadota bacterium]